MLSHPKVKVLCLGTNRGPGASRLQYAEKDARDVAALFAGRVGFASSAEYQFAPTIRKARAMLAQLVGQAPDVFVFFNSGHGNSEGILLADGLLRYEELASWIARIDATHTLTILDVCHAGAYLRKHASLGDVVVGGVDTDYLELLASATASSRVLCSVGARRLSHEGGVVANGHFTASLLEGASVAAGRLYGWIDDEELAIATAKVSWHRYGQEPLGLGMTGDLPLLRAQAPVLGSAALVAGFEGGACVATTQVMGRLGVPTELVGTLTTRAGRILFVGARRFVPAADLVIEGGQFVNDESAFAADPTALFALQLYGRVELQWTVEVRDLRQRVLARRIVPCTWTLLRRAA